MTNEDIVKAIQNGFDVTENMQWLYQKNLPLIKVAYGGRHGQKKT